MRISAGVTSGGRWRRAGALVVATALGGGALTGIASTSATAASGVAADDRPVDETFTYTCAVVAGAAPGLSLGNHAVGVRTQVQVPTAVSPGESIASRSTQISLTMPETLRAATVGLLSGRTAGGSSQDAAVDLAFGSTVTSHLIQDLEAPQTPIPQSAGQPWVIATEGTVPVIQAPDDEGTATLSMPARFTVVATVHTEPATGPAADIPATMDCEGPAAAAERALTTIDVQEATATPVAQDVAAGDIGITAFGYGPKVPVTLKATGGTAPYTFAVATKHPTATVTIDGSTAAVSTTSGGARSFTYTATDANGQVSPPATVTYTGVNNAPLVRDLHFTVGKGKALDLWPYTRDDDYRFYFWQGQNAQRKMTYGTPDHGDLSPFLTAADVDQPEWGLPTADFPSLGHKQTYTPDPGFVGTDSFTYTATDNQGASSTATITVDVVEEKAARGVLNGVRYKCQPQDRNFETGEETPAVTGLLNYTMGGSMAFTTDIVADIPATVTPGQTFTPAPTKVDLVMPQGLAEVLVGDNTLDSMGLGQTEVGGSSDAAAHFVETATGREYDLPLQGLSAEGVEASWPVPAEGIRIPTVGTLDPVTAPQSGTLEVHAPETMVIKSKLAPGILGAITDVWLQCAAMPGQDLRIGTTVVTAKSTTRATIARTEYGKTAVVKVSVGPEARTGKVEVRRGSTVVGSANVVNGRADVRLRQLPVGTHALSVRYLGTASSSASSTTVRAIVSKASSRVRAKVATRSVKAKRTTAKVAVTVTAPRGLARGVVTIRLKGKVVGKARVSSSGRATVHLKKFAKAGTHRLVVSYAGNGTVRASATKVTVKVRR